MFKIKFSRPNFQAQISKIKFSRSNFQDQMFKIKFSRSNFLLKKIRVKKYKNFVLKIIRQKVGLKYRDKSWRDDRRTSSLLVRKFPFEDDRWRSRSLRWISRVDECSFSRLPWRLLRSRLRLRSRRSREVPLNKNVLFLMDRKGRISVYSVKKLTLKCILLILIFFSSTWSEIGRFSFVLFWRSQAIAC